MSLTRCAGVLLVLAGILGHHALADEAAGAPSPGSALPRSAPEQQGVPSAAIREFIAAADQDIDGMHSFMLVRHGCVIAECWWRPYDAQTPHMFYSLSKSFTSTAVGIAIGEGKMSLDDEVLKAFPEDAPAEPSANLRAMRVRDLLRMAAGHLKEGPLWNEAAGVAPEPWTRRFLAQPVDFKPGTRFLYDTPGTYMLSAMVQKATGMSVLEYLRPRLFAPLGYDHPTWMASPQGISVGGFGLMGRTEDIARFGQLYLQKGMWQGRQLIPAAWVAEATTLQTGNGSNPKSDWDQGYCYQFWRCRHHAYRGDGAFGQYCIVMPDSDAVVAITSGVHDMQAVLNLVWDKLLPAMGPDPLPGDAAATSALATALTGLTLRLPAGQASSPLAAKVSGSWYAFPENDRGITQLSLDFSAQPPALVVRTASGEVRTPIGIGAWGASGPGFANGIERFLSVPAQPLVSASGAWSADDTFTVKLALCQTPFTSTLTFHVDGPRLVFNAQHNVAFGPSKCPQLIGEPVGKP
jgi:CubicO group peptidase (beta-lactamase class C family)